MREKKSLNYNWYFTPSFNVDYLQDEYEYQSLEMIDIPHTMKLIPLNYFNEEDYQFTGFYVKEIEISEDDFNFHLYLKFNG